MFGRLNDFAEAFVLLYEIEHEIRDVYTEDELQDVLESMTDSASRPAIQLVDNLKAHMPEHGTVPAIGKAIKL